MNILTAAPEDLFVSVGKPEGSTIYVVCEYMERQTMPGVYRVYRDVDKLVVVTRDSGNVVFNWSNVISIGEK